MAETRSHTAINNNLPFANSNQNGFNPSFSAIPPMHPHNEHHRGSRSGQDNNYIGLTRLPKLNFPRFNGEKVKEWLFQMEQFFEWDHTPEEVKISLASLHFENIAATWHHSIVQSEMSGTRFLDWYQYRMLLKERFEELLDDPIAELKRLRETDGIEEYHERFGLLCNRVHLSEEDSVRAYLAGLQEDTQLNVRMFQPRTIQQCLMIGRLYERVHPRKTDPTMGSTTQHTENMSFEKGFGAYKQENDEESDTCVGVIKSKEDNVQPRKSLPIEEMNEKGTKELCYLWDGINTLEHANTHKIPQPFLLEIDGAALNTSERADLGSNNDTEVFQMGISNDRTMQVRREHGEEMSPEMTSTPSSKLLDQSSLQDPKVESTTECMRQMEPIHPSQYQEMIRVKGSIQKWSSIQKVNLPFAKSLSILQVTQQVRGNKHPNYAFILSDKLLLGRKEFRLIKKEKLPKTWRFKYKRSEIAVDYDVIMDTYLQMRRDEVSFLTANG